MKSIKEIKTFYNLNLKPYNTLRINSFAKCAYFPKSKEELTILIKELKNPVIIGGGSNIIFSSNGVEEPVIFLKELNEIRIEDNILYTQAGVSSPKLSKFCEENSIEGFEFLIGIPSSVGGNIFMNAGANNQEISDNIISCEVLDLEDKNIKELKKEELNFEYRSSFFKKNPNKYIILGAKFNIIRGEKKEITLRMKENIDKRKRTQPSLSLPNAGSTFKNPIDKSAGKLLDECGLKGFQIGEAKVYENHANFIINCGGATSKDIISLMLKMQDCVYNKFSIRLESEILFIGKKDEDEEKLWKKLTTK